MLVGILQMMDFDCKREDSYNDAAHALLSLSSDAASSNCGKRLQGLEISNGTVLRGIRTGGDQDKHSRRSSKYNDRQVTRKMNALLRAFSGKSKGITPSSTPDLKLPMLVQGSQSPDFPPSSPSPSLSDANQKLNELGPSLPTSSVVPSSNNPETDSSESPVTSSATPIATFLGAQTREATVTESHLTVSKLAQIPLLDLPVRPAKEFEERSSRSLALDVFEDGDFADKGLPDDPVLRKREKNRLAARRSRARKSQLFSTAHNEIERLSQLVSFFQGERIYLMRRVAELEGQIYQLRNHGNVNESSGSRSPSISQSPTKAFPELGNETINRSRSLSMPANSSKKSIDLELGYQAKHPTQGA